jgi:hypothetical protein
MFSTRALWHMLMCELGCRRRLSQRPKPGAEKNYEFAKDELEQVQAAILQRELEAERLRYVG